MKQELIRKQRKLLNCNTVKESKEILLSAKKIQSRVKQLAEQIAKDYRNKDLTLVSVLKGSIIFVSDLVRYLTISCKLDFMAVTSYIGSKSSGATHLVMDLRESPEDKDILLVEDIVDTGLTIKYLSEVILSRNPHSLKVCALLDKINNRQNVVKIDYLGFRIPNKFVVGYGLDYNEKYRNLSYIAVLQFRK